MRGLLWACRVPGRRGGCGAVPLWRRSVRLSTYGSQPHNRHPCDFFAAALIVSATASALEAQGTPPAATDPNMARARRVLSTTPLVDGHNDLPWAIRESKTAPHDVEAYDLRKKTVGHTDLDRLKKGMVGAQFWSIYIPGEIKDSGYARVQLEQFDIARRMIAKYPDRLQWALTADAVRASFKAGKIGSLLGLEGGHAIENSLGALRVYYDLGARYMTLTHNVTLDWADAALDAPKHGGLTNFGKEVVHEMNRLGMLVDLSHVSPGTMSDALDATEAPVIFSHSGSRELVDHPAQRAGLDSGAAAEERRRGDGAVRDVVRVEGGARRGMTRSRRATTEARQRLGNDTAAVTRALDDWTQGASAAQGHVRPGGRSHRAHSQGRRAWITWGSAATSTASRISWSGSRTCRSSRICSRSCRVGAGRTRTCEKLAGENVLRVLKQAEVVSARLKKERPPSTKTIQQLDGKVASSHR